MNKPLAKFRVPVNSVIKRVVPRSEMAPFGEGAVPPISPTCCKNSCSVLMGARMKLSRSSSQGMPSGSLAAQVRTTGQKWPFPSRRSFRIGRETAAAPRAVAVGATAPIRARLAEDGSLSTIAKTSGNTISRATKAVVSSARTNRPPRNMTFGSEGGGCSSRLSCRRHDFPLIGGRYVQHKGSWCSLCSKP